MATKLVRNNYEPEFADVEEELEELEDEELKELGEDGGKEKETASLAADEFEEEDLEEGPEVAEL